MQTIPAAHRRPPSPWSGSRYATRHAWQLDQVRDLAEAADRLRAIAAELTAAHRAGWALLEPMRNGHVLAARPSRRQRGQAPPPPVDRAPGRAPTPGWRLRLVDEPPTPGDEVLHLPLAARTAVLSASDRAVVEQVGGPALPPELLAEVRRQLAPGDLDRRTWGVARARVGPSLDLLADRSALRVHAVRDGDLVRTVEALSFQHAADGAGGLLDAATAYERLARVADLMTAAGGRLTSVDDGLLQVFYGPRRT